MNTYKAAEELIIVLRRYYKDGVDGTEDLIDKMVNAANNLLLAVSQNDIIVAELVDEYMHEGPEDMKEDEEHVQMP